MVVYPNISHSVSSLVSISEVFKDSKPVFLTLGNQVDFNGNLLQATGPIFCSLKSKKQFIFIWNFSLFVYIRFIQSPQLFAPISSSTTSGVSFSLLPTFFSFVVLCCIFIFLAPSNCQC